jgi:hypothetical protein
MDQLILYEFQMVDSEVVSAARAEAWKCNIENKHDSTMSPAAGLGEMTDQLQMQVAKLTRANESLRTDVAAKQQQIDDLTVELRDFGQVSFILLVFDCTITHVCHITGGNQESHCIGIQNITGNYSVERKIGTYRRKAQEF